MGILWGTATMAGGNSYWVRHHDRWYLDTVRERLAIGMNRQINYFPSEEKWCLKVTRGAEVATLNELLEQHGWKPRSVPERPYPAGPLNDRGFVRAWVELHASADVARPGRKRVPTPRLRIYGNWLLLEDINRVISIGTGLGPRKPQKTPKETTVGLYYTGKSFCSVVEWLYASADLYNPAARKKFEEVIRRAEAMRLHRTQ